MTYDQPAPDFEEIVSRADFHLGEAERILNARYIKWGKNKPTLAQRSAMRKAKNLTARARTRLRIAQGEPHRTDSHGQ